ncbi:MULTISPECIES: LamG domain-containing protein [unclassified Nocardia]|uniref:LamG domain-containing protein n=1 Tax=unclassified Nocardia TaxID=2637762 RepID=UPI001CE49883|nr:MULTISPECIES: LamG domain-containing protein [unclassified Nocardia]
MGIDADRVGALNVGAGGDSVSVFAWIRRAPSPECHFVAGIWVEDDHAPKRQYGLFVDLPLYGGADRVCGHVSRTGGRSPGLPFSRDYSASDRVVPFQQWQFIGFTYDGDAITSYLDGIADSYRGFTEPAPPDGLGLTYAKNPYRIPDGQGSAGMNDAPAEFTVGAVRLTRGPGNHFAGEIGGIAVFDAALTGEQVRSLARAG